MVGAGTYDYKKTARPMKDLIPIGVEWIQKAVSNLDPKKNSVQTSDQQSLTYDYLVVALGLTYNLSLVEGLEESLDTGVV